MKQGTGVLIAGDGSISVDWTAATGLVKLNNTLGYNAYVWPAADGAASTFLRTDGGGNLSWAKAGVTVSAVAPTSPSIGDLWFDCATGQLKVWESCTTGVAQWSPANIGLPVLPISTSASPAFTSGTGTTVDPYICTLTTTASGSTVAIVNTVTVTGLAPNQFVAIQDLNTAVNGGRFTFTNYFADNAGDLVFSTIFQDLPASVAGTTFTAAIKVGFASAYIDSVVNIASTFALVSPGSISGTAAAGSTLTYTLGSYSGGTAPVTEGWVWKKGSDGSTLQTGGATYVIPSSLIGDRVYVTYTATDSLLLVVTGDTTNYPSSPATITASLVTNAVAPITIPGTANFVWADGAQNLSATGCIEFSLDGGVTWLTASTPVTNGATITTQWKNVSGSGVCGDSAHGTVITGTLTDGTRTSNFSLTLDRVPDAFTFSPATETITPNSVTITNPSFIVAGINAPAKIWGAFTTTGSLPEYSVDGGTTWTAIPTAPGTDTVDNGETVQIRFTTGAAVGTEVFTLDVGASTVLKQSGTFTVTVTNSGITNAVAPTTTPGTANFTWADGAQNLSATGCIEFKVGAGSFTQASTPVVNGDTITTQWVNVASSGLCGDAASGTTITGTLTDGSRTTTFSLTLDRNPSAFTLTPLTNQALSSTVSSNVVTLSGTNAPAYLTYTAGATSLTSVTVSVNGGAFVTLPTSGTTVSAPPGATLQFQGTTGAAYSTAYTITVNAGTTTASWSVTTTAPPPSITTPSIATPANGSTNIGNLTGVTLTGSTYTPLNGAGTTQTSSTWELYKWVGAGVATAPTTEPPAAGNYTAITGSPISVTSSPFTKVSIPKSSLTTYSTYYARVKYATSNATATTSSYSGWSGFTTNDFPPIMTLAGTGGAWPTLGSVGFDGTNYIVAGSNYRYSYSTTNLTSWAQGGIAVPNGGGSANFAVWTGSRWVMAFSQTILPKACTTYSTDAGATWTATNSTDAGGSTATTGVIVKDSSNLLTMKQSGFCISTDGGVTWGPQTGYGTANTTSQNGGATSGIYNGGRWLVPVGSGWPTARAAVVAIPDPNVPAGWSTTVFDPTSAAAAAYALAANGTTIVAVGSIGNKGVIYSSLDGGLTWTQRVLSTVASSYLRAVTYGGGFFMAVGLNDANYTSSDGITWVDQSSNYPLVSGWQGVAYLNGKFVANGGSTTGDTVFYTT